jgi:hypothetical protein
MTRRNKPSYSKAKDVRGLSDPQKGKAILRANGRTLTGIILGPSGVPMPILLNHHMIRGPHHLLVRAKGNTEDMQKPDKGMIPKLFGVTIANHMVIRPIGVLIIQIAVEDHLILGPGVLHVTVPDIQPILVMPPPFAYQAKVRKEQGWQK